MHRRARVAYLIQLNQTSRALRPHRSCPGERVHGRELMFERLVITNSESTQPDRKWYFLFSSVTVCIALVAGLVSSLFSKDLSLGNDDFALMQLVTPVEQPVTEPEPPAPEEPPQRQIIKEQTVAKAPAKPTRRAPPTRRV